MDVSVSVTIRASSVTATEVSIPSYAKVTHISHNVAHKRGDTKTDRQTDKQTDRPNQKKIIEQFLKRKRDYNFTLTALRRISNALSD